MFSYLCAGAVPMDCRTFQKMHVAYVDDLLPAVRMEAMHRHRHECPRCARHDAIERRALMLVRNLPRIEPSADFRVRLDARLRALPPGALGVSRTHTRTAVAAALAAVVVVAAIAGNAVLRRQSVPLTHAPVVAVMPEPESRPVLTTSALVASISSGVPMIPVALLADDAPVHFANAEFRLASFSR